jgi:hypothetical protein
MHTLKAAKMDREERKVMLIMAVTLIVIVFTLYTTSGLDLDVSFRGDAFQSTMQQEAVLR